MIIGLDISHWQSTNIDWAKMVAANVKFIYLKASQGANYKDDCFEENYKNARAAGLAVGAYHFTTKDNALAQYNNFVGAMGDKELQLPPALDCEYYTAYAKNVEVLPDYTERQADVIVVTAFRYDKPPLLSRIRAAVRGYSITTAAIVDSMGMKLTAWMQGRANMDKYKYPAIYTNVSSGNAIFTYPKYLKMNRYPLWVANWKVTTPNLPAIWKGLPYLAWQDGIVAGDFYGVPAEADHNIWGELVPFPGSEPPPPPPDPEPDTSILATIEFENGKTYSGRLERQ